MTKITDTDRQRVAQDGFWFVDIPRTSSSAIRSELGRHFGVAHGKRNIPEKEFATPQTFPDHRTAMQMRTLLGDDIWQGLLRFSVVRNPWTRMLSFFSYRRTRANVKIPDTWTLTTYLEHIARARDGDVHETLAYPPQYMTCSEFLVDDDGDLMVNHILRYENRTEELVKIGQKIGLPELGQQSLNAATPKDRDISDFYNTRARDLVAEIYAEDCERFGYRFPQ